MSVSARLLGTAAAVAFLLAVADCGAEQPDYNARIIVRMAAPPGQGADEDEALEETEASGASEETPDPWAAVRERALPARAAIAGESRILLAPSGRRLLSVRPTQVATGGRLFVYGKLAADLAGARPSIEVMLRKDSRWQRERVLRPGGEGVGRVGFTLVVPELEPGPVLAAMAARGTGSGALVSEPFEVPAGARLRLGFSLDEWDWRGLAPVTVSVVASVQSLDGAGGEEWEVMRRRLDAAGQSPRWFDEDIDLGSFTGERITLSFRTRVDSEAGLLAPQVVWSRPAVVYRDRSTSLPPSFAVIWADSLRAESLGCCGSERDTSPYMDRLFGDEGLVFDRMVAQSADTRASVMSFLASMHPSEHGVLSERQVLAREAITLAEAMSAAGYSTAAFSEGGELAAELGFDRGFDVYYEGPAIDPWLAGGRSEELLGRMLEWLQFHDGEPRLVFFHSYDIGWPYLPDPAHSALFDDDSLDRPSRIDRGALVRYEREIRGFDDSMRAFVARLDKVADPSRTLLVVSSAHGEEFGEHGALRHGGHLYDETVRVPLMLRGLGLRAGSRYRGTIGHIDLAPTILGLAGAAVPPSMVGTGIGKALASGLPFTVPERISEAHAAGSFAVSRDDHKVIVGRTAKGRLVAEAYDLTGDPEETSNLLAEPAPPEWAVKMRERLSSWATRVWEREGQRKEETEPSFVSRSKLDALER